MLQGSTYTRAYTVPSKKKRDHIKMKCLICKKNLENNATKVFEHYENEHNVDRTNEILLTYISSLTRTINDDNLKVCGICGQIYDNYRILAKHMLLNHRNLLDPDIDSIPIISVSEHLESINKHIFTASIYRSEHYFEYNWSSLDIIDNFLQSAKVSIDSMRIKNKKLGKINVNVSFRDRPQILYQIASLKFV